MSATLWRFFLQDDVDSFRKFLANATFTQSQVQRNAKTGSAPLQIGSPSGSSSTPTLSVKPRKSSGNVQAAKGRDERPGSSGPIVLSRADVNAKDSFGRTLLHHCASSHQPNASEFLDALLGIPFIDLYTQDTESGWTALHRALYFGNIAAAQTLMRRDIKDATDYTTGGSHTHAGGLIKIKDHEGNSPFEVFGQTIAPRSLEGDTSNSLAGDDTDSADSVNLDNLDDENDAGKKFNKARINLQGDEVYVFGSNKNVSLGVGDQDDRQYPERIQLRRPEHLLRRLDQEHRAAKVAVVTDLSGSQISIKATSEVPALTRFQSLKIQDVMMSKLHTAIITTDPEANLFICGFGAGGRLGTGDESTRYGYVCIEGGGLARKRIATVALGQDHSVAVSSGGEVFTWGSNRYGQLGYSLPQTSASNEVPTQLLPRQLFGPMKKEAIVGAAASSIHSAIFTISALYTFGKNEGQLGLMDADARSLDVQVMPRRVGVSLLQAPIEMVSAIDRATSILLQNHDVIVLTHYGFAKVTFQLEGFTNYFLQGTFATRYDPAGSYICKVTSGGNTICALSSFGEVFTIDASKKADSLSVGVSTTNPVKARNALPHPLRVWSIRKSHMAARDVAVGQDGSIILSTESGSVWRKEKRAIIKDVAAKISGATRSKDYKFVRIPNITRAVGVRSNAFGAFTAIRRDCQVTREQIVIDPPTLWKDLWPLLPFSTYGKPAEDSETEEPKPRFWTSRAKDSPAQLRHAVIQSKDAEADFQELLSQYEPLSESPYDLWLASNVTDVRIPVHSFLVKARSDVLRRALTEFQATYYFAITDILAIEYGADGQIQIKFQGADFLTLANLVLYLYTEDVIDVWHHTSKAPRSAARYRQVRTELMKIATNLEMRSLERGVRIMTEPRRCLRVDFEAAVADPDFFSDADVTIELAEALTLPAHSALLCCRCPFFDGLFHGRAGGAWMSSRRTTGDDKAEPVRVNLKHIDAGVFEMVLRHMYADTGEELFDNVISKDIDELLDLVLEVMSVANELMMDRLAQICQNLLGKFVTMRNVCQLLNAVAPCSVSEFKHVALEYICLNLESMLEHRLLEELDPDLLVELDAMVQENQLAYQPFARSGRAEAILYEKDPGLAVRIVQAKERRIDSMRLRSRLHEDEERLASLNKFRVGSLERMSSSPSVSKCNQRSPIPGSSPAFSPVIGPDVAADSDMLFEMDEDRGNARRSPGLGLQLPSPGLAAQHRRGPIPGPDEEEEDDVWLDARGKPMKNSVGTEASSLSVSASGPARYSASPAASRTPRASTTTPGLQSPALPWSQDKPVALQTGLKDIMAEASASKPSNLTLSLGGSVGSSARSAQKLSQRERKRQQQQQQQQQLGSKENTARPSTSPNTIAKPMPADSTPTSPWQTRSPVPWQSLKDALATEKADIQPAARQAVRPPMRTTMTMRQTVARTPPPAKEQQPKEASSNAIPAAPPVSKLAPPQIQSIRHTPVPAASASAATAQSSLSDILVQQQSEKVAVKEAAAAKRSLQEIQQEQEFQQWWDSESRRIQEEEAQARANTARDGRGKRGRGRGGSRRGGGRGGGRAEAGAGTEPRAGGQMGASASVRGRGAAASRPRGRGRGSHGDT